MFPGSKKITPAWSLCIGVFLIYLAFLKVAIVNLDGQDMLSIAISLSTKHEFSVESDQFGAISGRGGHYYSNHYPLLPILSAPVVSIGLALSRCLNVLLDINLPIRYSIAPFAILSSILLITASTVLVRLMALRLGSSQQGAYLSALSFAFGTIALVYAQTFFAEPLLTFITTLSLYLMLGKLHGKLTISSILSGLAVTAKPAGIITGPVFSAYLFLNRYPFQTIIRPLLGTAMGLGLYLIYNYLRFENIFKSGQNPANFHLNGMPGRLWGLLFSPGAGGGLLYYCPVAFLAIIGFQKLFKTKPREAILILGMFLSYWFLHSFWAFGGWNWGPRFLLPVLPSLCAVVGLSGYPRQKWLIGLTLVGFWVNAPTLVTFYENYFSAALSEGCLQQALALWGNFSHTPMYNIWGVALNQVHDAMTTNLHTLIQEKVTNISTAGNSPTTRILPLFWWSLPILSGCAWWVGAGVIVLLLGFGFFFLHKGWSDIKLC
jgi:hypothetical protein